MKQRLRVHPYIPNSVPEVRRAMMDAVGIGDIEELYSEIPDHLRFKGTMNLPKPMPSEYHLRRHVEAIMAKNKNARDNISFLGAGCWPHYVPAVVDEVVNRAEFLTAYCGDTYSDHGKFQARFEFYSLMGELLNLDVVSEPIYDWGAAAGLSLRMAARITGRNQVLIPRGICPERLGVIKNLCQPEDMKTAVHIRTYDFDINTGLADLEDLERKISDRVAAVYMETPSYFGVMEIHGDQIASLAKAHGALAVAGVDPISLGILTSPADDGFDILCGDLQPLGVHMLCGGGQSGFIAFRDEEIFVAECPLAMYTLVETQREGEFAYAEVLAERTSYGTRDKGKDWVGTASGLWTIAAAVYLSLMGPRGMQEVGETILQNAAYARRQLEMLPGVKVLFGAAFKEFLVNFDGTGHTVAEIHQWLKEEGIFGGKDVSREYPELGQCALYCVTETHMKEDIDHLIAVMKEGLK
ncbi:MAG: aminomethyl-transferring glycine dehydrogenase subunit GcvPA [Bacillota bacterium]|nr:aminomethyl-transferring glycine dehydrogenase subunit GcvPA [Bacillota bacterium]MDW7676362.1 aminomethyl-transferring glycine dehydrogenase subunit GcvPA [Bacillota bacterium]